LNVPRGTNFYMIYLGLSYFTQENYKTKIVPRGTIFVLCN